MSASLVKAAEIKALTTTVNELSESYTELAKTLRETTHSASAIRRLWRVKNKPILIKIGLALIAFPDPTISDVVGAALVAAGTVQMGIQHNTIYAEDVYKTFQNTFRELQNVKHDI